MTSSTSEEPVRIDPRSSRRAAAAGAVGSVVEWYDFGLYGVASALYIRPLFFGGQDEFVGLLLAFATFAVGFGVRPIGGIVLGNLGDRYGRKPILLFTVILMGVTTTLMGVLPTSQALGPAAALLLVLLRLLQGFGSGAELAGAFVYVTESAPPGRRNYLASFSSAAIMVGLFLSTGVFALLVLLLSPEAMLSYGWRIPFLLSSIIVVVAVAVRARLTDTPEFERLEQLAEQGRAKRARMPIVQMLRESKRSTAAGLLVPSAISVSGYVITVYALSYLTALGVRPEVVLAGTLTLAAVSAVTCVCFGRLADRIGSGKVFIGGAVWFMVFAFPLFAVLRTGQTVWVIVGLTVTFAVGWSACSAAQADFMSRLFPTKHRYSGVATTRELNASLLGGPAPFIAVALSAALGGEPWLVAVFMVVASVLTIAGVLIARTDDATDGVPPRAPTASADSVAAS